MDTELVVKFNDRFYFKRVPQCVLRQNFDANG